MMMVLLITIINPSSCLFSCLIFALVSLALLQASIQLIFHLKRWPSFTSIERDSPYLTWTPSRRSQQQTTFQSQPTNRQFYWFKI